MHVQLFFGHCKRCKKCVFLHACHINCHVGLGWGGVWGVMTSLNMHACLMLRHPWGWGGVGGGV